MTNDKLNILLTCDPEIPVPPEKYGGIERIVDALVNGLVQRGHSVTLCANGSSNVPCRLVAWKGAKSQHLPHTLRNLRTLTEVVLKNKFDLVHSFSRLAYMGFIMPSGIPKIMSYQREPSVSQVRKAVLLSAKNSLWFTGCSNYITNQVKPHAQATTIYNAAPFNKFELETAIADDAPLAFLGRIEEIKGVHNAIKIAQQAGKRLIIAGNIPPGKEHYFQSMVRPYLNAQIEYVGPVNDQQKSGLLRTAMALLMPICWNEPFGIVMAEAMACGTPVIGFAKGAVPEVIDHGVTGFVCRSIEDMILAVDKLQQLDRRSVREHAESRFSESVMVDAYIKTYLRIRSGVPVDATK